MGQHASRPRSDPANIKPEMWKGKPAWVARWPPKDEAPETPAAEPDSDPEPIVSEPSSSEESLAPGPAKIGPPPGPFGLIGPPP